MLLIGLQSCATYYQKNLKFNSYFEQGQIDAAEHVLQKDKKWPKGKNRLLYYLNKGVVNSIQGKYEESNRNFEQAHIISDSYQTNLLNEGVALLSNPNITEYKGEDFELLLIHYYKALNFLKMGNNEEALVECRRMNIRLNQLGDKYKNANKYRRDAFIHLLMGLIYDANKDYNNAFIAYRNALEIYNEDYSKLFGISAPEQLKKDLLRAANRTGFYEEQAFYEKQFGMKYNASENKDAEVVFLWHGGLGPVKSEWSINFSIIRGHGGNVMFVNQEFGMSFNFAMSNDDFNSSGLSRLEFIRVAMPRYIERSLPYASGYLEAGGKKYPLEKVQDINGIAIKSLHDRIMLELGRSLLRLAMKKVAEYQVRQQNANVGAAVGILNAVTEKADTRHWSTIPHSVYYKRIPLNEGNHNLTLQGDGPKGSINQSFAFDLKKGQTWFHTFHSF
ncbi:MAG: COG3014 family protein [Cytophagaceae bacterium]